MKTCKNLVPSEIFIENDHLFHVQLFHCNGNNDNYLLIVI